MGYYLLYFFVAVGAKLLLALVMIYFLLPKERSCAGCDGETLLVGGGRGDRLRRRLSFGRLQLRWCPGCGWQGLARCPPPPPARANATESVHTGD